MVQIKNVDFVQTIIICSIKSFWVFCRKSKWDFEKIFSSHFIEMRILRWESHLSSPKWELWTENLISLRVKWDYEMRIFFLTSEMRFLKGPHNHCFLRRHDFIINLKLGSGKYIQWVFAQYQCNWWCDSRIFQNQGQMYSIKSGS